MKRKGSLLAWTAFLLVFTVLAVCLVIFVSGADEMSVQRERELMYEAVSRSAVTCYTLEGRYPADLQYLIDNYGLTVDPERYIVGYNAVADNLRPEIFVTVRR